MPSFKPKTIKKIKICKKYTTSLDSKHKEFIKYNMRGYGYWIWKSLVLIDMFKKTVLGDIIIYSDSGCGISTGENARLNYTKWNNDVTNIIPYRISFIMNHHLEYTYTKNDLFDIMECNSDTYKNTGICSASIQIYKNTADNFDFISKYYKVACIENYHYLTDEESYSPNDNNFKEHRHDQSILSLLFKKYGSIIYTDHWKNYSYPIVTLRRKY